MTIWCEHLVIGEDVRTRARIVIGADGTIERIDAETDPQPGDLCLGVALPGVANGHSHAFHRALRGRTHHAGGDFWVWREAMYAAAARLDPELYHNLARAVFAEMVTAGYTAVGEFHYVHHKPDGTPYPFEMELAIARAAADIGIRLVLLDTAYLAGGINRPLSQQQLRFGDGSAPGYLSRWHRLRDRLPGLGAALHSVRGVPPEDIETIVAGLPDDVALHIHLSEQPQENADAIAAFGATPTRLLARLGVLSPRLSAVHATHLTADDIELLGAAGVTVVMCPTTESDLGDGIGPARDLHDAGTPLALGSDQNAVIDPFAEIRGLEMQERLRSGRRGRFTLDQLAAAAGAGGYRSLGLPGVAVRGGLCDLVEVDPGTIRTLGADLAQLPLAASAVDVTRVVVGGRVVAERGRLVGGDDPAELMRDALERLTVSPGRSG